MCSSFVGKNSGYTVTIPIKSKAQVHNTLQDFIRDIGAPLFLVTDRAKEETLGEWQAICCTYCIKQHTTESYYQNQNHAERQIGDIKRRSSLLMDLHDCPERYWDYAVQYATDLINHSATERLLWRTPKEILKGDTPDISIF